MQRIVKAWILQAFTRSGGMITGKAIIPAAPVPAPNQSVIKDCSFTIETGVKN